MKKIIFFFGSFDPIHTGHLKIAKDAINLIKGDKLYFGLNKSSNLKNLTPFSKRKKMIELAIQGKNKFDVLDIKFDYKDLEKTYTNIFNLCLDDNEYYILIGEEQLSNLNKWYKIDLIKSKFKFIIASRTNDSYIKNDKYLYLNNKIYDVSSTKIKQGDYKNLDKKVKEYIIENNIYLKDQIKPYLSKKRLEHTKSVKNTALKIYKSNKDGLNKNKIVTATLLHDIAKEYPKDKSKIIMKKYYPDYLGESEYLHHQYVGEYIAKKKFHISDPEILESIKSHTTGNEKMSRLAKILFVSDKIEPNRGFDSTHLINACINSLDEGFILVLKDNINFLKTKNIKYLNDKTLKAINYYLKGEI